VSDNNTKVAFWVVGAAAAAAIIGTLAVGARSQAGVAPDVPGQAALAPAEAQPVAAASGSELPPGLSLQAMVAAESTTQAAPQLGATEPQADAGRPLAQVAFESGQASLSAKAKELMADIAGSVKTMDGATLVLSGFHDATGSPEINAKLAKDRALAVRDALMAQGMPAERIRLLKPQVVVGGADPALARRVDIGLIQ
jgi:outer membrane protein OmpA-like peptidoglycan-associated protein